MNVTELQHFIVLNLLTVVLILLFQSFSRNGIFFLDRLLNCHRVSSVVGLLPYGFRTSIAGIEFFFFSSCCSYTAIIRLLKCVLFLNNNKLEIEIGVDRV